MKHGKKLIIIAIALLVVALVGGISYALWGQTNIQEEPNIVAAGCFELSFEGENDIKLINTFPKSDEVGMTTVPYVFTIRNICTVAMEYDVNLEVLANSTLDSSYVKVALDNYTPGIVGDKYTREAIEGKESRNLISGYLAPASTENGTDGGVVRYNLRIWVDESAEEETMEKSFYSKIVVTAVNTPTKGILASTSDISLREDGSINYYYYIDDTTGTSYIDVIGEGETQESAISEKLIDDLAIQTVGAERLEELKALASGIPYAYVSMYGFATPERFNSDQCTEYTEVCYNNVSEFLASLVGQNDVTEEDVADFNLILDKMKPISALKIYEGVTEIGEGAFTALYAQELSLPNSVESVGYKSFQYNEFRSLSIPGGVKSIGCLAFSRCEIENLELSEGIETFDERAFYKNNITEVTIPSTVSRISYRVFEENALEKVTINSKNITIAYFAFCNESRNLVNTYVPSDINITWDGTNAANACASLITY